MTVQDALGREIRAEMGRQRLTLNAMWPEVRRVPSSPSRSALYRMWAGEVPWTVEAVVAVAGALRLAPGVVVDRALADVEAGNSAANVQVTGAVAANGCMPHRAPAALGLTSADRVADLLRRSHGARCILDRSQESPRHDRRIRATRREAHALVWAGARNRCARPAGRGA